MKGNPRKTTVIRPDGVRIEQDTDNAPGSLHYGLLTEDRTYPDENSTTLIHRSTVAWYRTGDPAGDADNTDQTYRSPRPTRTEVFDDRGQKTATDYAYGTYFNQVADKTEYGYGGTARLHRAHSDFENDAGYRGNWINRHSLWYQNQYTTGGPLWSGPHLFNLVLSAGVDSPPKPPPPHNPTPVAYTRFRYDEQSLVARSDAGQLASAPTQRGNLTMVKRYADAVALDDATAIIETRGYDVCGNVVTQATSCCEQTSFEFNVGTQYGWPMVMRRGSATDTSKQNVTSYGYDVNTGLLLNWYDANNRYWETYYQTLTLRPEWEYAPTGAYNYHIYDDANLVVYDLSYKAGASGADVASRSDKYLDGHGRVHGEVAYGKDYVADVVNTKFDNLGRLWQQSRAYRSGTAPMYTYAYDTLDRTTSVTAPDGSTTKRYYNQHYESNYNAPYPSAATQSPAGQTVLAVDAWNRERWVRFDEQNRLVEVVEPAPNGTSGAVTSNGLKTSYTNDTLGNLTLTTQGDQTRSFKYDALSRLKAQKLAELDATLNDTGTYVGTGQWSDVFNYDNRSNLTWRVDARGVKTIFTYNSDPLNRLQSVEYHTSGVPSGLIGSIPSAPKVDYAYMASDDKTRLLSVAVNGGMGHESFQYDSEGRMSQASQTFPGQQFPVRKREIHAAGSV